MKLKNIFCAFLVLLLLSQLSGQSAIQNNLTSLEDYITSLENESLTQKILIEDLEKQLNNAEASVETLDSQLKEILVQQEMLSNSLKKSEHKSLVLKWFVVGLAGTTITATGIAIMAWNKK